MPVIHPANTHEVKFVRVNASSDGDNEVVAAVAEKRIRVIAYSLTADAAGTFKFQDTASSPVVFGEFDVAQNAIVVYAGGNDAPAFETSKGVGLEINAASSQDVTGHLTYQLI